MKLVDEIGIIKSVVDSIDNTIHFTVTDNELFTCDNSYVSLCDIITIDGEEYEVDGIIYNEKIILDNEVLNQDATIGTINRVKFRHGTVAMVNAELVNDLDDDYRDNYPLVFLLEEIETSYNVFDLPFASSNLRLFFINQTDRENNTTTDYHNNNIKPLKALVNKFLEALKKNLSVEGNGITEFDTNMHPLLAYTNRDGYEVNIFDDHLSGVQLNINVPFKQNFNCCKK